MSKNKETIVKLSYVGGILPSDLAFTEIRKGKPGKFEPSGIAYETLKAQGLLYLDEFEITRHQTGWVLLGRDGGCVPVLMFMADHPEIEATRVSFTLEVPERPLGNTLTDIETWLQENKPRLSGYKTDKIHDSVQFGGLASDLSLELFNGIGHRRSNVGYTATVNCRSGYSQSVSRYLKEGLTSREPVYDVIVTACKALVKLYLGEIDYFGLASYPDVPLPGIAEYGSQNTPRKIATLSLVQRLLAEFSGDEVALKSWLDNQLVLAKKEQPEYEQQVLFV